MKQLLKTILFGIFLTGVLLSCSSNDEDTSITPNANNAPRAGSRWVFHLTIDQTYTTAPPNHYETDVEWVAKDTTIDNVKWLAIWEKNLTTNTKLSSSKFGIRAGTGGWRCKLIGTPKEGLWLAYPADPGTIYNQTHPYDSFGGFTSMNYDVATQVVEVINYSTGGVVWQNSIHASFSVTTNNGDLHYLQNTHYTSDGPLLLNNSFKETNDAAGQTITTTLELKSFTR